MENILIYFSRIQIMKFFENTLHVGYIYICFVLTLGSLTSIAKKFKNYIYVYYIYLYIYTSRWSNERRKTKTTMLQKN